jgi:DNA repair ATPase RecN
MMDAIVKLLAEVLCILAIATKEIKENCASKLILGDRSALSAYCSSETFVKKLAGRSDIEDALQRLETVIVEEARMAATEALKGIHDVQNTLNTFGGVLQDVGERVKDIMDIDHKVAISAQTIAQLII